MTYDVLIQRQAGGTYRATAIGWPDLSVVGNSEQMVIERIRQSIRERLEQGKLVQIEVDKAVTREATFIHPWRRFLGMWKNDTTFDDLLARMQAYRREMDEATAP